MIIRTGHSKLQASILVAVILGSAAFLAWRFRSHVRVDFVLEPLPNGAAAWIYVDVAAIRQLAGQVPVDGPDRALEWVERLEALEQVDVAALAFDSSGVYLTATGDLSAESVTEVLADHGVRCSPPLGAVACTTSGGPTGPLSLRMLGDNLLGLAAARVPAGASRLGGAPSLETAALAAETRSALGAGAVAWAAIHTQRFDELMRDPPQNWVNLSLVSRALLPAQEAYFTLVPLLADRRAALDLRAECLDELRAAELERILVDLNRILLTLAERKSEPHPDAAELLRSFQIVRAESRVDARWTASPGLLGRLAEPSHR